MFIPHVHSIIYYGLLKNSNKLEAQSLCRSPQTHRNFDRYQHAFLYNFVFNLKNETLLFY